jgi:hypothetical protein
MEESCKRDQEFGESCPGYSAEQNAGRRAKNGDKSSPVPGLWSGLLFSAPPCRGLQSSLCSGLLHSSCWASVVKLSALDAPKKRSAARLRRSLNHACSQLGSVALHQKTPASLPCSQRPPTYLYHDLEQHDLLQAKSLFWWNATSHSTASSIIFPWLVPCRLTS